MSRLIKPIRCLKVTLLNFCYLADLMAVIGSEVNFWWHLGTMRNTDVVQGNPLSSLSFSLSLRAMGKFLLVLISTLFPLSSHSSWLFSLQFPGVWVENPNPFFCPKIHMGTVSGSLQFPNHVEPPFHSPHLLRFAGSTLSLLHNSTEIAGGAYRAFSWEVCSN